MLEYNNNYNKWILSILWWMSKLHSHLQIENHLKYHVNHFDKNNKDCFLDYLFFQIKYDIDNDEGIINNNCYCECEEGVRYLFDMLKEIGVSRIKFGI